MVASFLLQSSFRFVIVYTISIIKKRPHYAGANSLKET